MPRCNVCCENEGYCFCYRVNGPECGPYEDAHKFGVASESRNSSSAEPDAPADSKPMNNMTRNAAHKIITITTAQTILDCYDHAISGTRMVRDVARNAGLYPLSPQDRAILKEGMGEDRFARFVEILNRHPKTPNQALTRLTNE